MMRRASKLVLLVCISLCVLLMAMWLTTGWQLPVALAHAFVIGSDPVDGSTVATVPAEVRIFFDAPISSASFANVYTPDEHIVNATHSSVASSTRELDTPLLNPSQLPPGSYTVRWTAIASDDGHTTHGVIGFNVGQSSAGLAGQTILGPTTSNILPSLDLLGILTIAWDWLVLLALTCWIGILIAEKLVIEGVERMPGLLNQARKRSLPLQWLGLAALLVGECIALILRASQLSQVVNGGGIDLAALGHILTQTLYGYLWFARVGLILCALGFLWWTAYGEQNAHKSGFISSSGNHFGWMRQQVAQEYTAIDEATDDEEQVSTIPDSPRQYTVLWLLLAGLILLTYALAGDAAQLAQLHLSAIVLDWLFLVARCVWLGGLTYLGYILLPLLPGSEPERHAEMQITLLQRFHPFILGAVGVFLVSGFYLTDASMSDPQQFLSTPYGRILLIEGILVAIMLLLSGYALLLLRPKLIRQSALLPVVNADLPARRTRQSALEQTARSLTQSLVVRSWLGAGVLLCAALMTFFAPPIVFPDIHYTQNANQNSPSGNPALPQSQTQKVGDLTVILQVLPGRVDYANTVIVTMNDVGGNPVSNAQVQIHINMELMDMGTAQATIKGGNPIYLATFNKDKAFSMFGRWDIALIIRRPGQTPVQTMFTVTLN